MPPQGPSSHLPALGCCFVYPRESQMPLPACAYVTQSQSLIHSLIRDSHKENAGEIFPLDPFGNFSTKMKCTSQNEKHRIYLKAVYSPTPPSPPPKKKKSETP